MKFRSNIWMVDATAWPSVERALLLESAALTDAQAAAFDTRTNSPAPAGFNVSVDGVATIEIFGVLTPEPDWVLQFFGGGNTAYSEIRDAIAMAEGDSRVKSVEYQISSPGGNIAGLFEAIDDIRSAKKPSSAKANLAASAAYSIASAAGKIEATGASATFGSIGIVSSYYVTDRVVDITSTAAPDKRPNPGTEEGQAVIRAHLDEIHALFADGIANDRGITAAEVNEGYGGGRVFLAAESKRRGMIDGISQGKSSAAKANKTAECSAKGDTMDLDQFKAEHPKLYASVVQIGATEERDRVDAHLILGEASGDLTIALAAVRDGSGMTASIQAKYMAAGLNKNSATARAADDEAAAAAIKGAAPAAVVRDLGDIIADAVGAPLEA
jgi:ClpP class serine protease